MDYTKILLACCFLLVCNAAHIHIPEVYESNSQKQPAQDSYEKPPVFNYQEYQKGGQVDPQRIRYQQQQQVDKDVIKRPRQARIEGENKLENIGLKLITAPSRVVLEDLVTETPQLPKGRIAKKSLKPNSYLVNEEVEAGQKRQDDSNYFNYVDRNPKVLQQNLGGFVAPTASDHLPALNSLLGQTPENQLHGLQQLLNRNQYYKDHTPIKEDFHDVPNQDNKPNIQVQQQHSNNHVVNQALQSLGNSGNEPNALKSLQAQLDATASAHAESIIAQAQKKALEHVKAQHAAIARAQQAAEHAALEEIKAQNEASARAHAQAEAEAETKRQQEEKEKDEKRKAAERRRQANFARERARVAALAYKHKQEQEKKEREAKEQKDDPHTVAQATRIKNSQKTQTKFPIFLNVPAETQNHYFAAPSQLSHYHQPQQLIYQPASTAQTYHQAIQAQPVHYEHKPKYNEHLDYADVVTKYYVPPQFTVIGESKNSHGESELHYAANYEFGYRIHDYDHGNDYGHKETKDGDTTKGEYHVLLPDGRKQTVSYYVDPSGYHAEVSYGSDESNAAHQ